MNLLNHLYSWYGKRTVLLAGALVIILLITGILIHFLLNAGDEKMPLAENLPQVHLRNVADLVGETSYRITGSVSAISEAKLQTEAGGRVTSVNASLGDRVSAGTVIATLENSAQRAQLLQAEGSYEAALAGAASSESGTESARTQLDAALASAVNTYKSSFISADSSVRNTIDDLFSDPAGTLPGFKLDGFGMAVSLNNERTNLEPVLDTWSTELQTTSEGNIMTRLGTAIATVERIASFAETLASLVARQDTGSSFTQAQKDALEAEFVSIRSTLNQALQALESAKTSIETSQEALDRAQIAGSGSNVSLADAQVKSALGSLRAAQSSYEKTLVRTPISGVVNALYLKTGEYVSPSQPAATIANNNALEITAYVTEAESASLAIGQNVIIGDDIQGAVSRIAPAVDPSTSKVEIKISTESTELTNGDTVSLVITRSEQNGDAKRAVDIVVPITALKVETDRIVVFTVSSDKKLIAHPIVEGPLVGENIIIEEGIDLSMNIVLDARGLNEGDEVEIAQ